MPRLTTKYPSYRRHYSGQGIVTLNGKDYYCGPYEEQSSRDQYDEYIARWLAHGRRMPGAERNPDQPVTITELVVAFWDHAETYCRKPDGAPTTEVSNLKTALKPLLEVFGETEVKAFGPKSLKALQQHMVGLGWCRTNINRQVSKIEKRIQVGSQ